jgi:3-hydroxyacyl-[acyl-carrier-protein] dehydratase
MGSNIIAGATMSSSPLTSIIEIGHDPALFEGHFPGHPILPGAKLIDLVIERLQLKGALTDAPIEVVAAKFLATIAPGSQLVLSWTLAADGACRFECKQGSGKVASGVLRNRPTPDR